jgi:hypothetical protein
MSQPSRAVKKLVEQQIGALTKFEGEKKTAMRGDDCIHAQSLTSPLQISTRLPSFYLQPLLNVYKHLLLIFKVKLIILNVFFKLNFLFNVLECCLISNCFDIIKKIKLVHH